MSNPYGENYIVAIVFTYIKFVNQTCSYTPKPEQTYIWRIYKFEEACNFGSSSFFYKSRTEQTYLNYFCRVVPLSIHPIIIRNWNYYLQICIIICSERTLPCHTYHHSVPEFIIPSRSSSTSINNQHKFKLEQNNQRSNNNPLQFNLCFVPQISRWSGVRWIRITEPGCPGPIVPTHVPLRLGPLPRLFRPGSTIRISIQESKLNKVLQ